MKQKKLLEIFLKMTCANMRMMGAVSSFSTASSMGVYVPASYTFQITLVVVKSRELGRDLNKEVGPSDSPQNQQQQV